SSFFQGCAEADVLIISGRGSAFSSGIDINILDMFERMESSELRAGIQKFQKIIRSFETVEKPVIAMVNGAAIGWGMELALACDIILSSEDAIFGFFEVSFGLVTDLGATERLPRLIGVHRAKELIMTGKRISASEAEKIGLVNHVYSPKELFVRTLKLADRFKLVALGTGWALQTVDRQKPWRRDRERSRS
ncbi:MAG: enoyl-CoA hydratase/isomerase family protein, partial [Actinobacteria bacterium]|nr:enoyl-CoA hydratase/isomerase family protein [Actinomycetota bacterium]